MFRKWWGKNSRRIGSAFSLVFLIVTIGCSGGGSSTETSGSIPNPPPFDLTSKSVSSSQVDLIWKDNSFNEDGFRIERSIDGVNFTEIAVVPSNVTSYSDIGSVDNNTGQRFAPLPATQYYYRVYAFNGTGNSAFSNIASTTTDPPPQTIPAAPSTLSATSISSARIDLMWTDNADNETGFKIKRSIDNINFSEIAQVTANVTTYSNTNLSGNTTFYYKVYAFNSLGDSQSSNVASATTFPTPATKPANPTNLSAVAVSSSQINLSWTDNSNNEDEFIIERSLDGASFTGIANVIPNTSVYQNIGLNPSTTFYYRVKAHNSVGDSDYTNVASTQTLSPPLARPNAPSGLVAAVVSSTQINLSWTDNSNNEESFRIERSTDGTNFAEIASVGANITGYNNTGLSPSTNYWYRVRARNSAGDSDFSATAVARTLDPPANKPNAPSSLSATAVSSSQIDLRWVDNSDNENGFYIERSTDGTNFTLIRTTSPNVTSFSDTGLSPSTRYYYRVRAFNAVGDSEFSNIAQATTPLSPLTVPNPPSGLIADSVSSSEVRLRWLDNSDNEQFFSIDRGIDDGKSGIKWTVNIATVNSNVTDYTDKGLSPSTKYYYRVRAGNSAGYSAYSNTVSATTSK